MPASERLFHSGGRLWETVQIAREKRRLRIRKLLRLRWLLRWMPSKRSLGKITVLKQFGAHLQRRKYLWSFKENRVAPAIFLGSVIAFLPIFGVQLLTVVAFAALLKVNLPVIAGLQFVSNPLTLVPIYLANYKVGSWILQGIGFAEKGAENIVHGVNSTMVGGAVLGTVFGLLMYGFYVIRIKRDFRTSEVAL